MLDWDRIRVFHAVAEAGSFTRAAEHLGLSQSAVSRQISALEEDLGTPLFHRHARGLVRTEQGEILLQTARDVAARMATAQSLLSESRERPAGLLRVNTTVGFGAIWLVQHLAEFLDLYPEINVSLLPLDAELDLSMRQADVAIRLSPPTQPDLIRKRLLTVHTHVYGAPSYLERYGTPETPDDLDNHRLITYSDNSTILPIPTLNWVVRAGAPDDAPARKSVFQVNNVFGMIRAAETGVGLATLPDYLVPRQNRLVRVLPELEGPSFDAWFVYPEELRHSKRVAVFREFLLRKVAEQAIW
ncbi:LysR family transcriptional regulator [Marinivivus vitaminiproducens]|uniref:LysR family transcriptional regulator n=1 Tax=Marinivivus vitaminiproducens TaxID=3035935 RepID=UPI0027A1317D|nr:LysR family transcriptional regulator [Geminicoccaceae bacterium SCSIO 64248]